MAEPVSVAGTAIAVTGLLHSSCRSIADMISSYQRVPKEYQDLAQDLNSLAGTLGSLQNVLRGTNDSSLSAEQRHSLKETTTATMSQFAGKVEALSSAVDSLSIPGLQVASQEVAVVRRTLAEHSKLLKQALPLCTSALKDTDVKAQGTQVRNAKAMDHARQVVGNLGAIKTDAPTVSVDVAQASGAGTFQGIGNVDITGITPEVLSVLVGK